MSAHILIVVSIAMMPATDYRGKDTWQSARVAATWSSVALQRFESRPACEHAARQIRAMQGAGHDVRMTCQPVGAMQ